MNARLGRLGYLMFWFGLITSMSILIVSRVTNVEMTDAAVRALGTDTIVLLLGAAQYVIWGGKSS